MKRRPSFKMVPPNCEPWLISHYKGFPCVFAFVALRDIKKGEFLHFDHWADHFVKQSKYLLSKESWDEISQFFQAGFLRIFTSIMSENRRSMCLVQYLFYTPAVFIRLHLCKLLSTEETLRLVTSPKVTALLFPVGETPDYFSSYPSLLEAIRRILGKEASLASKCLPFLDDFCALTCCNLLLGMAEDPELCAESLPAYRQLGEVLDDFFAWFYQAKWKKFACEPRTARDLASIVEKSSLLPPHQHQCFSSLMSVLTPKIHEQGDPEKLQELENLLSLGVGLGPSKCVDVLEELKK